MDIKPINGWGEGKPVHECALCDSDTRGRTLHYTELPGTGFNFVCDWCYADLTSTP